MTKDQMTNLVGAIVEQVYGDKETGNRRCAPVTLQIGFVNDIVVHNGVVILNAPAVVTEMVMAWVENSRVNKMPVYASAGFGGLLVQ
ncbi:MAG TPA: hypothetical protein VGI56_11930 [Galbitalea sp.]